MWVPTPIVQSPAGFLASTPVVDGPPGHPETRGTRGRRLRAGNRFGGGVRRRVAVVICCAVALLAPPITRPTRKPGGRTEPPRSAAAAPRPNILLLVSDDQAWSTFSRDLMPSTFRDLVDQGMLFKRAYVNTSLCCPSRSQILTGLFEHHTGVDANTVPLDRPRSSRRSTTPATGRCWPASTSTAGRRAARGPSSIGGTVSARRCRPRTPCSTPGSTWTESGCSAAAIRQTSSRTMSCSSSNPRPTTSRSSRCTPPRRRISRRTTSGTPTCLSRRRTVRRSIRTPSRRRARCTRDVALSRATRSRRRRPLREDVARGALAG